MYGLPLNDNNISYDSDLQSAIKTMELIIEREYRSSLYFHSLLKSATDKSQKKIIRCIIIDKKQHLISLKKIYLEITKMPYNCKESSMATEDNFKRQLMWCLLDKFQIVKIYNSLIESIPETKHKASLLKILNDELLHIGELNNLLS